MSTNVFYRLPSQHGTKLVTLPGSKCSLKQFWDHLVTTGCANSAGFLLVYGLKSYTPSSCQLESIIIRNDSHVDVIIPLVGGKGGFGSLLRAIGAQIEKTTNRDACRDLQGRRLRDVKREDELRKLIALQERLQEERKRRKQEKLEKLRKSAKQTETSLSIQELIDMFDDKEYNERRHNIGDIIQAAVCKGIINTKTRQNDQCSDSIPEGVSHKKMKFDDTQSSDKIIEESRDADRHQELKADDEHLTKGECFIKEKSNSFKTNNLWLGLESDEENDYK